MRGETAIYSDRQGEAQGTERRGLKRHRQGEARVNAPLCPFRATTALESEREGERERGRERERERER